MSSKKSDVTCPKCKAKNPADYTFCYHCRVAPKKGAKTAAKSAPKKKSASAKK